MVAAYLLCHDMTDMLVRTQLASNSIEFTRRQTRRAIARGLVSRCCETCSRQRMFDPSKAPSSQPNYTARVCLRLSLAFIDSGVQRYVTRTTAHAVLQRRSWLFISTRVSITI